MKIYIHVDEPNFDIIDESFNETIETWLQKNKINADFTTPIGTADDEPSAENLGLTLTIKKGRELKDPLNFLYGVAKTYKSDFVLGIVDESGDEEDICYFGHEEGKPDVFEISAYLGVKV